MRNRGLTLLELVAAIVIMGLAIPALLRIHADVGIRSIRAEAISAATFYAEQMLEEIKARRFDENANSPWSAALGPESGETYPAGFDDIDDFNGRVDTPATGYSRTVTVDYVTLTGTTWGHSAGTTNFKRAVVSVSRTDNNVTNVHLDTIITN